MSKLIGLLLRIAAAAVIVFCTSARAQWTVNFAFTNRLTTLPDTNTFLITPVGGPVLADGGVLTRGPSKRMTPNTNGISSALLLQGNYAATNAALAQGIVFQVPPGTGTAFINDLAISGYNIFVSSGANLKTVTAGSTNISVVLGGNNYTVDAPYAITAAQATNIAQAVGGGAPGQFVKAGTNVLMTTNANVVTVNGLTDTNVVNAIISTNANVIAVAAGTNITVATNVNLMTVSATDQTPIIVPEAGLDTNAVKYCDTVGVYSRADRQRISDFCRELQRVGLWSDLVDAGLFRSNLNNGGVERTLFLKYGTNIGSPYFNEAGLNLDGIAQATVWPMRISLTNHTVIMGVRGTTNEPSTSMPWSLVAQPGVATAGVGAFFGNNFGAYGQVYAQQNGSALSLPAFINTSTNQGWSSNEPRYKTAGILYSGATSRTYVDGLLGDPLSSQQTTTPLTTLVVGGRPVSAITTCDTWWAGAVSYWVVFDRTLTWFEAQRVERALRYLEPQDENLVIIGDSTSWFNIGNPTRSWPVQMEYMSGVTNRYRIYNMAANGVPAYGWYLGLNTNVSFLGPGGSVRRTDALVSLGINDFYLAGIGPYPDLQTEFSLYSAWKTLADAGMKVIATTVYPLSSNAFFQWTPTMEQSRSNVNNWIIYNARTNYSDLIRLDALFSDPEMATNGAASLTSDGVHLGDAGYFRFARAVIGPSERPPNSADGSTVYTYTNLYATDNSRAFLAGMQYVRSNGVWVLPSIPLASLRQDLATNAQVLAWNGSFWAPTSSIILGGKLSVGGFTNRSIGTNSIVTTDANKNETSLVIGPGLTSDGTTLSAIVTSTSYVDNATNQLAIVNSNRWDPLGIALTATNQLARANTNLWDPLGIALMSTNQLALVIQSATNQLAIAHTNQFDPIGIALTATNQLARANTNLWDPIGIATAATNQLAIVNSNRWDSLGIALTATNQLARANTNLWDPLGIATIATNNLNTALVSRISDASNHTVLLQGTNIFLVTNVANGITAVAINSTATGGGGSPLIAGAGLNVTSSGGTNTVAMQDPLAVGTFSVQDFYMTNFWGTLSSSTNVAVGGNISDMLTRTAGGTGMSWQAPTGGGPLVQTNAMYFYRDVSGGTVEVPVYTNSHPLTSSNNLFLESWVNVDGPTNYLALHWDAKFRGVNFSYSNNISSNASGLWMSARWATNPAAPDSRPVLYLKSGLTNENAWMLARAQEMWDTNGTPGLTAPPYLITEGFEETGSGGAVGGNADGFDSPLLSRTNSVATVPDPDFSTAGLSLVGSQCLKLTAPNADVSWEFGGPTYPELYAYVQWRAPVISGSSDQDLLEFYNAGTFLGGIKLLGNSSVLRIYNGTANTFADTVATVSANTTYHLWLHYKTDGTCQGGFTSNGTYPSGNNLASVTGGNATLQVTRIRMEADGGTDVEYFDHLLVAQTQIPNNP